ncbi:MAG: molecular chaperone DnaJ, partial [Alphaproteobacteria bacterium]|nr:molecular chaperone DnaJ [Alphaproteobacteria bacterium]
QGMGAGGFGGFHQAGNFDAHSIFEEMLRGFGGFGGAQGGFHGSREQSGSDVRYDLNLTLEQAYTGCTEHIKYAVNDTCKSCDGSGGAEGSKAVTCSTCKGLGAVHFQQGIFTMERTCHTCDGSGKTISNPCQPCRGQGRVRQNKTLEVNIPAGVDNGTRIRMSHEGEAGVRGGPKGDLYIYISIKNHKFFKRSESNLYCSVPVSMVTAALGGQVQLPTIEGTSVELKIPEGTQSGAQLRLRGKGMSTLKSAHKGDLIVEIKVETPIHLSAKQKELLTAFKDAENGNSNSPQTKGFFDKVKDFFDELKG